VFADPELSLKSIMFSHFGILNAINISQYKFLTR